MAGLSDLIASTKQTSTELPSWYSSAQQNTIDQARQANVPTPQQTVGQQAVSTLSGQNNPFAQAQNILGDVASGAANPWLTDASGKVTPNTATPLGGLFSAQQQYLNQVLPDIDAQATAGAIGSGNFGSLRGLTAMNKARGDALAKMQSDQYKTALEAQDQAIKAGAGLGNVGVQGIEQALKTGEWQQTSPLARSALMAKILSGIGTVPQTQTAKTNLSPLAQVSSLGKLVESPTGRSILGNFGVQGNNLGDMMGSIYNKLFGSGTGNFYNAYEIANPGGGGAEGWRYFSDGTSISPEGVYYKGDQEAYNPNDFQGFDLDASDIPGLWADESYD